MNKWIYDENGNLERDGFWEWHFSNGKLWQHGNFKDGKLDGLWELYYYGDGMLREINN